MHTNNMNIAVSVRKDVNRSATITPNGSVSLFIYRIYVSRHI